MQTQAPPFTSLFLDLTNVHRRTRRCVGEQVLHTSKLLIKKEPRGDHVPFVSNSDSHNTEVSTRTVAVVILTSLSSLLRLSHISYGITVKFKVKSHVGVNTHPLSEQKPCTDRRIASMHVYRGG